MCGWNSASTVIVNILFSGGLAWHLTADNNFKVKTPPSSNQKLKTELLREMPPMCISNERRLCPWGTSSATTRRSHLPPTIRNQRSKIKCGNQTLPSPVTSSPLIIATIKMFSHRYACLRIASHIHLYVYLAFQGTASLRFWERIPPCLDVDVQSTSIVGLTSLILTVLLRLWEWWHTTPLSYFFTFTSCSAKFSLG